MENINDIYTNLQALTRQESGIIMRLSDHAAILCDWSDIDGIPWVSEDTHNIVKCDESFINKKYKHDRTRVRNMFDISRLVYIDDDYDIKTDLEGTAGQYIIVSEENKEYLVIVPDEWD